MTTFVLRLLGTRPEDFLGLVEHVATGQERAFRTPEELLDYLETMHAAHGELVVDTCGGEEESEK